MVTPDFLPPPPSTRYPDYEFISDNSISWSAGLHNRYTENSLRGVILDIHFLSQTDFLVCTFSSQVSSRLGTAGRDDAMRHVGMGYADLLPSLMK